MIDAWTIAKGLLLYTGIIAALFALLLLCVWSLTIIRAAIAVEDRRAEKKKADAADHDRAIAEKARRDADLIDPNSNTSKVRRVVHAIASEPASPYPKDINHG